MHRVFHAGYQPNTYRGTSDAEIKTQCAVPTTEAVALPFWAMMAPGQIAMRRVDGWQTLGQAPVKSPIVLAD